MKHLPISYRTTPWVLLVISVVVYGILTPKLGFYWDDFPYTWLAHNLGAGGFQGIFFQERPLLAVLYNLTAPILGENIFAWQVFAILTRWLTAVCVWTLVENIWPDKKSAAWWISVLFLLYPGFSQQWISTIYSRIFLLLSAFLFSLICMLKASRAEKPAMRWLFHSLSILFSLFALFSSEYFVGVELIRPFILWFSPRIRVQSIKHRLQTALKVWMPTFICLLGFVVWRVFFVQTSLYSMQALQSDSANPLTLIGSMVLSALQTGFTAGIRAWGLVFDFGTFRDMILPIVVIYILVLIFVGALVYFFSSKFIQDNLHEKNQPVWGWEAMVIGVVGLLAAGLPFWAAGLPFSLVFPYNRFTLPMMLPAALLLTGLVSLIPIRWVRLIILVAFAAFSAGQQVRYADTYRVEWAKLNILLHQLTWRIPSMQEDTMLVAYELPLKYYSDNSLTAAINWTYAPEINNQKVPFLLSYLTVRQNSVLSSLEPDQTVVYPFRKMDFRGNTSDVIVIEKDPDGCLTVLDSKFNNRAAFPDFPPELKQAIALSNLNRINQNPSQIALPIPAYFDPLPQDSWCFFFEKAELARQSGDWQQVADIYQSAQDRGRKPNLSSEYYPFIEGLGMRGQVMEALDLSREVVTEQPSARRGVCQIWSRIRENQKISMSEYEKVFGEFTCDR